MFPTLEAASQEVDAILDLYARIYTDLLAVPVCKVCPCWPPCLRFCLHCVKG